MSDQGFQESAFTARLVALNALFEAARSGPAARDQALFIAFGEDMCSELARLQLQEVLDALCKPTRADSHVAGLVDDLQHFNAQLPRTRHT